MLEIIKFPNPILRERMPEFDFTNPSHDPVQLEKDMLETMYAHEGIGLSANQVGIRARMFVMGNPAEPDRGFALFNPLVVANTNDILDLDEGCLSFPGIYVKIKRPESILARWQNTKGEWQESEFHHYDCKCFLHELDHLEGIVFQDRASDLRWSVAVRKSTRRNT